MGSPWHPGAAVAAGGKGLPAEHRDSQLLLLLGQSFSLSMGVGFRMLNFVCRLAWSFCSGLALAFFFFFLVCACVLSPLTAGLAMLDGNSCSNSHFNLENTRVGGTSNLCALFQFWELRTKASLVTEMVEINNKEGRATQGMTQSFVKIKESKRNGKIYYLVTYLFHLPLLTIYPGRLIEHGTAKDFTISQWLKKPLALQGH